MTLKQMLKKQYNFAGLPVAGYVIAAIATMILLAVVVPKLQQPQAQAVQPIESQLQLGCTNTCGMGYNQQPHPDCSCLKIESDYISCTDSDGDNANLFGFINTEMKDGTKLSTQDSCNNNILQERVCVGNAPQTKTYDCSTSGKICVSGQCAQAYACSDACVDGGFDSGEDKTGDCSGSVISAGEQLCCCHKITNCDELCLANGYVDGVCADFKPETYPGGCPNKWSGAPGTHLGNEAIDTGYCYPLGLRYGPDINFKCCCYMG